MSYLRHLVLTVAVVAASHGAWAQTDAEHKQHHPAASSSQAPKTTTAKSMTKETMVAVEDKMKVMRDMHEKMMAAKTPEARSALMAEHMKTMQDGMAMMSSMCAMGADMGNMKGMGDSGANAMKGGMPVDMANRHKMMAKCMEMMSIMMPMMMDRLPAPAMTTK